MKNDDLLICVQDVWKSFSGAGKVTTEVLRSVCLDLGKGEDVAIVGPSGSGKSTLLHVMGSLESPDSGVVLFRGEDIYRMGDDSLARLRNREIGFVFQFHHLMNEFNALENVMMPLLIRGLSRKESLERSSLMLEKVGLGHRKRHRPPELSGGEQSRVAMARALVGEPSLLLADEPTGNLDQKTGDEILDLLFEVKQDREMSFVMVTHDSRVAARCRVVKRMHEGCLQG